MMSAAGHGGLEQQCKPGEACLHALACATLPLTTQSVLLRRRASSAKCFSHTSPAPPEAQTLMYVVQVKKCVNRQKRKSQLALLTIQASRQLLFVPDLLVPEGWSTATLEQPCMLYKVVAAIDSTLVSIHDGVTQYKLGQTLHAKRGGAAWPPLNACYFAFPTLQQAASAPFPHDSQLRTAPRMLIEVRCHGKGYWHRSDIWALPHMTTVGVISQITAASEVAIPAKYKGS